MIQTTATLAAVLVLLGAPQSARAAKADDAYEAAKSQYLDLKKDEGRKRFKHHWINAAHRFEAVATRYPSSDRAPEALYMAGDVYDALSHHSGNSSDRKAAEDAYRALVTKFPTHRLADDGALWVAQALVDRKEVDGARALLAQAIPHANDMRAKLVALQSSLPAPVAAKPQGRPAPAAAKPVPQEKPSTVKTSEEPTPPKVAESSGGTPSRARAVSASLMGAFAEIAESAQDTVTKTRWDSSFRGRPDTASARRAPVARPREEAPALRDDDEVIENAELPAIASLQERLRDVRVGVKDPAAAEASRARFKALAREAGDDDVSLAQQLGLKVRRVIIDAGHGGHDTGAIGAKGTTEKSVTLAISLKLAARLEALGLEVVLTREDDTYLKLEERTRFANAKHGDLFISIHCNAAPSKKLRGIETYTLNTSSNRYSIRLAARENAATERGVGDLQYILADLATKANTGESTRLAERVQQSLVHTLAPKYPGVKSLGHKEALFFVLLGAKMPAILVETSFLSNAEEEQRLADPKYQQGVADGIAEAVQGYLDERAQVARID